METKKKVGKPTKEEKAIAAALKNAHLEYTPKNGVRIKVLNFKNEEDAKQAIDILRKMDVLFEIHGAVVKIKTSKKKVKVSKKTPTKKAAVKAAAPKKAIAQPPVRRQASDMVAVPQDHIVKGILLIRPKSRLRILRKIFKGLPKGTQQKLLYEMKTGDVVAKKAKNISNADLAKVSKRALEKELAKRWK